MIKINFTQKTAFKINTTNFEKTIKTIFALLKEKESYEIDINLICPLRMKKINRQFRQKNEPTTVLSFATKEAKGFIAKPSKRQYLGEIFLCPEKINSQAQQLEISTKQLMTTCLVHGILHLLGYSHQRKAEAKKMEDKEAAILKLIKERKEV